MGTLELKSELIGLIQGINDTKLLKAIYILLTQKQTTIQEVDFWDELPEEVKNDIEEALKEADRGEVFSHEEVMKEIKEKYNIR